MDSTIKENPETILLVEDDPAVMKMVHGILQRAGFNLLTATNADQAMAVEADFQATIHLLLSDVDMPGTTGPDLATALRKQRPQMRVMLMSGRADGAMLILNYGWYFIKKPFVPKALVGKVIDILHSKIPTQDMDHYDTRQ